MKQTRRASSAAIGAAVLTCAALLGATLLAACGGGNAMVPDPDAPHNDSTASSTSVPASSAAPAANGAPCGPGDCTPCDETKQKCMGPGVCGNHPERARRQCKRDTDGTCKDMIVCAAP